MRAKLTEKLTGVESYIQTLADLPENCIYTHQSISVIFAARRLRALKYNVEHVFDLYGIYLTFESKYKINYFIH